MLGAIATALLNVRSLPSVSGKVLGQLTESQVVRGTPATPGWLKFQYQNSFGFIATQYLRPINDLANLIGRVNTQSLVVRAQPSVRSNQIRGLSLGASINTLAVVDDWLEIEFNGSSAFVFAHYIDLRYQSSGYLAEVNTYLLNVRAMPSQLASVVGQFSQTAQIWVEAENNHWSQVTFNGNRAYVASRYIRPLSNNSVNQQREKEHTLSASSIPIEEHGQQLSRLTPSTLLPVRGTTHQRAVASAWNKWGALLTDLSTKRQLEPACSLAIVCVESSGKGFEQNNSNRMIIRFENHKFWKFWGRYHPSQFREHFQYAANKVWQGHKWRSSADQPWQAFHGQQSLEWQVFEFACLLDKEAAMLSISMGAPQIMGFHFERIGYQSVEEMFNDFSGSIQPQLNGLFDFFSPTMLGYIQQKDFISFAAMYNGKGQKHLYGNKIHQHYLAFKQLMPNKTLPRKTS